MGLRNIGVTAFFPIAIRFRQWQNACSFAHPCGSMQSCIIISNALQFTQFVVECAFATQIQPDEFGGSLGITAECGIMLDFQRTNQGFIRAKPLLK